MDHPRREESVERAAPSWGAGLGGLLLCAGVVAMGVGLKLGLIERCGNDIPYLDQWAAEGCSVLGPWLNDVFDWRVLFWPHGEHHPAVARISSLCWFVWNEQWDDRVQLVANLGLFAILLVLLGVWARRLFKDWRYPVALLAMVALLGSPGIYENYLWGFQSAFIGGLAFGLLHLVGMAEREHWAKWCLGAFAGVVVLFTVASGLASAVVLVAVALVALVKARGNRWAWATLLFNGGLVGWGAWLLTDSLPASGGVVRGAVELYGRSVVLLAWPLSRPEAVLIQVPLLVSMVLTVRTRGADRRHFLVAVFGGWCWVLAACLAVGRGNGFNAVAVRYWDVLAAGLLANVFAWLALWPRGRGRRIVWGVGLCGWVAAVGLGYWAINKPDTIQGLEEHYAGVALEQRTMVESYLRTGRFGGQGNGDTHPNLPHPKFTRLLLDDPAFRRVLPPSVVPACSVTPDEAASVGFARIESPDGGRTVLTTAGDPAIDRVLVSHEIEACGRAFLRLSVRGVVEQGVAELYVEDAAGGRHELLNGRVISPGRFKTEHLAGGARKFRIVARVKAGHELAFTEPVEIGWLSYLAPKFIALWPGVFWGGAGCFLGGVVVGWRQRRGVGAAGGEIDRKRSQCRS